MTNQKKYRISTIRASEWSRMSTRAQSKEVSCHDMVIVTWHNAEDLIVLSADSEVGKKLLAELRGDK